MKSFLALNLIRGIVAAVLFPILLSAQTPGRISLETRWRFMVGDSLSYADPGFSDGRWKNIAVDRIWEQQGYDPLDGFAWYRIEFVLPSSMKQALLHDSLRFALGKINNFDQTFLNGHLTGVNGERVPPGSTPDSAFLKAETGLWDVERIYVLPMDDPRIRWDSPNVIAIRVFDQGGQGGLWSGVHEVRPARLTDYFSVDRNQEFSFKGRSARKSYAVQNSSARYTLAGQVAITGWGKRSGSQVLGKVEEFTLPPGGRREFSLEVPAGDEAIAISFDATIAGAPDSVSFADESPYILTPPEGKIPRINGASVTGCRPGRPFLFPIAATGALPITYEASGLPRTLKLDRNTGIIRGEAPAKGTYIVRVTAKNRFGKAGRDLRIVSGDRIALTPTLGWNSWNVWGLAVDQQKVLASARSFRDRGLIRHGWSFVNIDDGWEIKSDLPVPKRTSDGRIIVNEKFPDMKGLADSLHAYGLKIGIYSSPGPRTCGGYTASYGFEEQDARSYGEWGIDYLKYDWCSYSEHARDTSRAELMKPYHVMRAALDKVNRDIVYSLCQYGMGNVWEWGSQVGGNLWRTTGDITDTWESMSGIGFAQVQNAPYAGPGSWNDPDMLVVGWVGWGPRLHPTRLTPDEQYTHISLWSLLSAPLLIGCDLERLDPFTLNLLTNDEILEVNQDPIGKQAVPVVKNGDIQVWVKEMEGGRKAVGVFNIGTAARTVELDAAACGIAPLMQTRDLWRQKGLGPFGAKRSVVVPAHGVMMLGCK